MPHNWQIFLAQSDDLEILAEITDQCRDKSLSLQLNRPGSFSCNIPLQSDWTEYLEPWQYCVVLQKNKEIVWSGPLQTKEENFNSSKIDLNFVGWFELLNHRFIVDASHTYTTTNRGTVAFNLLALANGLVLASEVRPTGITEGANTSTGTITKTFERWQNIGQSIVELTEIESGFDFDINPVTKEMNIREWSEFADRTDVVWGFGWGPDNLKEFTRNTDGDALKNDYYLIAQLGSAAHANDTDDGLDIYGVHQEVIQESELTDFDYAGTIANIELATNKRPRVLLQMSPRPGNGANIPSIFEDYIIGDKTYVTAKRSGTEILGQPVRIFGVSLSIDELGNENLGQMQITYSN